MVHDFETYVCYMDGSMDPWKMMWMEYLNINVLILCVVAQQIEPTETWAGWSGRH